MRLKFFAVAVILFSCVLMIEAKGEPDWYLHKEKMYPSQQFISAIGEGDTQSSAQTAAISEISMFFTIKTDIHNELNEEMIETDNSGTTLFSKKMRMTGNAIVESATEFLGIHFMDPWFDSKHQKWFILAYINKSEAAITYESKIKTNMLIINSLYQDAQNENEPLTTCWILNKSIEIADITQQYIQIASSLDSNSQKYSANIEQFQKIKQLYRTKRAKISFDIRDGGDEYSQRVQRKLEELLEQHNFVMDQNNPTYTISIKLSTSQESYDAGIFIRSGLSLRILDKTGKSVFSYSKNYPREGHKTLSAAYSRALLEIERDLEENFVTKLAGILGK